VTAPVLTFHAFDEPIRLAIVRAVDEEIRRYPGGDVASPIVPMKATRSVRAAVTQYANDGLMYRVALRWRQMLWDSQ
jgi:hypothetical protein